MRVDKGGGRCAEELVQIAFRCLASPLSLGAIGLLLLNDHALKWLYPSWVTGKLSDIAGLYFTPYLILLAASGIVLVGSGGRPW